MQVLDERKRRKILTAAAKLFAVHPFHKVLLSDVAEAAKVGKGTLYVYFHDKEDLFASILQEGFARLIHALRRRVEEDALDPRQCLRVAIEEMVHAAYEKPRPFDLMRMLQGWSCQFFDAHHRNLSELAKLIESIIRRGIKAGAYVDPRPDLTARLIPGLVRSAMILDEGGLAEGDLAKHLIGFVEAWLTAPKPAPKRRQANKTRSQSSKDKDMPRS
jgi:AcrR family transcriptional regulator